MTKLTSFIAMQLAIGLITALSAGVVLAQSMPSVTGSQRAPSPRTAAKGSSLYCAGYIQTNTISTNNKIMGAYDEADQFTYSENDFVYINTGRDRGVSVGDTFSIVRPKGEVKSKWSNKGSLGFYVKELGAIEVVSVKQDFSVARVKTSCDTILFGDLVQLVETRTNPILTDLMPLDRFADPTGKATGRILMARDGAEAMVRDFIAYVDLGAEDNVRVGDTLTIFRPLEKGNLMKSPDREMTSARDYGFESRVYKGGKFSNHAARKSGDKADGSVVRTHEVRSERRPNLRKVVGEAMVLNVKERTATIVITRTTQEVHTGDWVELN